MFQSEYGLFSCNNIFDCLEAITLAILSLANLYLFYNAYKHIKKDQTQTLDQTEKTIFYLAFSLSALLCFTLIIYTNSFFDYTFRTVYIMLDILICKHIAYTYFDEEVRPRVQQVAWLCQFWVGALYILSIIGPPETELENECTSVYILLYSVLATIVSLVLLGCGCGYILTILHVEKRESFYTPAEGDNLWHIKRFQELREKKVQLIVLPSVNFITSVAQLTWDSVKFDNPSQNQCDYLTYAHNVGGIIIFFILGIICYMLPSVGVYYVFYWRNKENFNSDNPNSYKNFNDFDDLNSDMIDI